MFVLLLFAVLALLIPSKLFLGLLHVLYGTVGAMLEQDLPSSEQFRFLETDVRMEQTPSLLVDHSRHLASA